MPTAINQGMTKRNLPICEKLRAVESGASDFIGDKAPICETCWHRNPDGPEAAAVIEELVEALEALLGNIGAASLVRNPLGKQLRDAAEAALAKVQVPYE